jgi:hypothetical protein
VSLALSTITDDFYSRAATDSAGSTLRALLGATSSIIPADKLVRYASASAMPTLPLLAWRAGVVTFASEGVARLYFNWYAYDAQAGQYLGINAIMAALIHLYPGWPRTIFPGFSIVQGSITPERPDSAVFNLPMRAITFQLTTRI